MGSRSSSSVTPVSAAKKGADGSGCLAIFFGLFLAVGLGFGGYMFVWPMMQIAHAQTWTPADCVIERCEVITHHDDDGSTYSLEVTYHYSIAGQQHQSQRYSFFKGSSSFVKWKREVERRLTPGTKTTCYVNPSDPTDAVIDRGVTQEVWMGLIPLAFVIVGGGGIVFALRMGNKKATPQTAWLPAALRSGSEDPFVQQLASGEPVVLKSATSPFVRLIASVLICAFWNGIVSLFVFGVIEELRRGEFPWFLMLFLTPFVIVGLLLFVWVGHSFLALFNPSITLTVSPGAVPLGKSASLEWRFSRRPSMVRRFQITLQSVEEATYRQGTSVTTDKTTAYENPLIDIDEPEGMEEGRVSFSPPANGMHSFEAEHNKVVWKFVVKGDIPNWPDISEEFPIIVLPHMRSPS